MSTELNSCKAQGDINELHVTSYNGGKDNGVMLQLTQKNPNYNNEHNIYEDVVLTRKQVVELMKTMSDWLE